MLEARRLVLFASGLGMTLPIPAAFLKSYPVLVICFSASTLSYATFSTMMLTLPADLYPAGSVASVSGMGGTGAGIGTIIPLRTSIILIYLMDGDGGRVATLPNSRRSP